jgi:hypothetical protein
VCLIVCDREISKQGGLGPILAHTPQWEGGGTCSRLEVASCH